ncbi:hypothetical protein [Bacillus sp. B-jedd]|uniref:hypothetical protein n=1 Tax=Bacillus sp. B-jedd TaxID=1476857 RepID=UPI00051559A0|nr:hypothetical protein [Bacillus sp. B-jedd]CEG29594.1 hypothetical protein BN1002_04552 [Bacillus sp. B-jedd]
MSANHLLSYLGEPRQNRVVILDDIEDFTFDQWELDLITDLWKKGVHPLRITKRLNRKDPDEILLALIHIARQGKIRNRKNGLMGVSVDGD